MDVRNVIKEVLRTNCDGITSRQNIPEYTPEGLQGTPVLLTAQPQSPPVQHFCLSFAYPWQTINNCLDLGAHFIMQYKDIFCHLCGCPMALS